MTDGSRRDAGRPGICYVQTTTRDELREISKVGGEQVYWSTF